MKKKLTSIACALYLLTSAVEAEIPLPQHVQIEEMVNDLYGIQNVFQSAYAPAEWKKEYSGWDIKDAVQSAIAKISQHPHITLKDYQQILANLFMGAKDYHAGIYFHSTEAAMLPFRIRGAEGRYFVAWVHPRVEEGYPLQVGDEVITFNGQLIEDAIDSLIIGGRRDLITETDIEQASIFLTLRMGALGHRVPEGPVDIFVRPKGSDNLQGHIFTWSYQQEFIKGLEDYQLHAEKTVKRSAPKDIYEAIERFNLHADMSFTTAKIIDKKLHDKAYGAFPVGDRRGPLPFLGTPHLLSGEDKHFFSYIFQSDEGRNIGYIRIPHFMGKEDPNAPGSSKRVDLDELRVLVRSFQRRTDALVIDLVDNSGGYLHVLLSYLSVLADRPMPFFKQRISITQEDVAMSLDIIDEIDGYLGQDLENEERDYLLQIRQYFSFLYDEWNAGRFLTNPIYLYGIDQITPDPVVTYKKPVLVLINGLDFSCADIFPAVLQDSKRAHLFGTKTAGAGGEIKTHVYPNRLGIASYTYTNSLIQRLNSQPIENLGTTPDTFYPVTADDVQNDYEGYRKAVHRALKKLIR